MSEDNEMSSLKDLYDELWSNAEILIQDMAGSLSFVKYSSFLLLALNAPPIYYLYVYFFEIPKHFLSEWGMMFNIVSYLSAIVILTFSGLKLLKTYLKLRNRFSKLMKMRLELED